MNRKFPVLNTSLQVAPCTFLCLSDAEVNALYRRLVGPDAPPVRHLPAHIDATTYLFDVPGEGRHAIVNVRPEVLARNGGDSITAASLLVHEAVHLWQDFRASISEEAPSAEFEAYSIQCISDALMREYSRRMEENRDQVDRPKAAVPESL